MIKLFTDLENLPQAIIPPLVSLSNKFVYVASIADCNYVLLPHWEVPWEYSDHQYRLLNLDPAIRTKVQKATARLIAFANTYHKALIVVYWSDADKEILLDNAIVLRTSLYRSCQKPNVFAYPSWRGDLQAEYPLGKSKIRVKKDKPSIGFRGSAIPLGFSMESFIRSNISACNALLAQVKIPYQVPYAWNQGQQLRKKVMQTLKKNGAIDTDFTVLTRGYINQKDEVNKRNNRQLFIKNMIDNDYLLCLRGAGNYSFRFYETLSAGRIPLFINTDCVLPYDFILDWKKYGVWVEEKDIDKIDEILLDFHHRLTANDFIDLQLRIRKLWEEWISPEGFFKNFDQYLRYYESRGKPTSACDLVLKQG